jgi:hypothetical protein
MQVDRLLDGPALFVRKVEEKRSENLRQKQRKEREGAVVSECVAVVVRENEMANHGVLSSSVPSWRWGYPSGTRYRAPHACQFAWISWENWQRRRRGQSQRGERSCERRERGREMLVSECEGGQMRAACGIRSTYSPNSRLYWCSSMEGPPAPLMEKNSPPP